MIVFNFVVTKRNVLLINKQSMKLKNLFITMLLGGSIIASGCIFSGCATMNNTGKGAAIGAGGGAILGAGIGALAGKGKGAAIGAAIGAAVGSGTGALIGRKMDKQKKELEAIEGAKVEMIQDANNLQAIKVTFDNGILFATNKSELSPASREALIKFALSLQNTPDTDVTIYGHTDNTGTRAVNERLSAERANSVANYLVSQGINRGRIKTEGLAYDQPVADNSTAEGRAQNRRVEVYINANATMIQKAENGQL
jgi:outer membrane protein OmpA-like peptidoglycan-associated protein